MNWPKNRIPEFFEGDLNRLSMTRLLAFMAWFPATIVVIRVCTETALGYYLSAFVFQLVGGKGMDALMNKVKSAKLKVK